MTHTLSVIQQISPDHLTARAVTTTKHVGIMDVDRTSIFASRYDLDNHATLKSITTGTLHAVTIVGGSRGRNFGGHDSARYPSIVVADHFLLCRGGNLRKLNM